MLFRSETPITPTYRVITYSSPLTELVVSYSERFWGSRSAFSGKALQLARPGRLRELLDWADLVLVETPWQFEYLRSRRPDGQFILSAHNFERARFASYVELQGRSAAAERRLRYVERLEAEALAYSSLTLAVSPEDRLELLRHYEVDPESVIVIPSGADTEKYHPVDRETKAALKRELGLPPRPTVAFVGSRFTGNRPGLDWVRRLAAATDRFTFLVVGPVSRPGVRGSLHATGRVEDVAPYLQAADLAVCPIQYGGGTKIKLFESLAAGLPTVAFAESLHGTDLREGQHVLVAEKTQRDLLTALDRLVSEPDLARRLGAAARAFMVEGHDWKQSAAKLDAALRELVGPRERRETSRSPARAVA